jgi:hypothetical protein
MLDIPRSLRIGGHIWRFRKNVCACNCLGWTDADEYTISLRSDTDDDKGITLVHELMHAAFFEASPSDRIHNEAAIQLAAETIVHAVRRVPKLRNLILME